MDYFICVLITIFVIWTINFIVYVLRKEDDEIQIVLSMGLVFFIAKGVIQLYVLLENLYLKKRYYLVNLYKRTENCIGFIDSFLVKKNQIKKFSIDKDKTTYIKFNKNYKKWIGMKKLKKVEKDFSEIYFEQESEK